MIESDDLVRRQSNVQGSGEIAELRELVGELRTEVASLKAELRQRESRITELERLLAEARRSGKRQAAPFSKGEPTSEPKRPG